MTGRGTRACGWSGRSDAGARLRALGLAAALAGAWLVGPAAAGAQEPEAGGPPHPRASVALSTGVLAPLNDLTADPASFGTAVTVSPVIGADLAVWPGGGKLGLGLQGIFAPGDLLVRPSEFQGAVPEDLGNAAYLAGTASVLYRLRLAGARGRLEPYFGVGGGFRHLAVQPIAAPEVEDVTDVLGTLAAGTWVWISHRLAVRFEARDHLLVFDSPTTGASRLQNDVLVTVGFGARLR